MSPQLRLPVRILSFAVLISAALLISGCGLLGWGETTSVSDPNNIFHVKVPASWQTATESGFVSIYADKELPAAEEEPRALSVLLFTSREESSAAIPEMLDYLVDSRAESRGWTAVKKGAFKKTTIGDRPATYIDVSAVGTDKKPFDSRYYFVRTGGDEVFVAAIAPPGEKIGDYQKDLERITKAWYWHGTAGSTEASETTPTGTKP